MPATPSRHIRLSDADWARLVELGRRLGPVVPLSTSDVVRVALGRLWEAESRPQPRPRKRPGRAGRP